MDNVELMLKFVGLLEEVSDGQKELVFLTRENAAKIDRTWPALARVESRILEIRRDVREEVGDLIREVEANKKKLTSSGRK